MRHRFYALPYLLYFSGAIAFSLHGAYNMSAGKNCNCSTKLFYGCFRETIAGIPLLEQKYPEGD
jgi:hypothetical protein